MDTKAAFEKWAKEVVISLDIFSRGENKGFYKSKITRDCWDAWTASRAAIEIELPGQENYDDPLSAHLAIKDCAEAITSHGIRIKGKTE